MHMICKPCDRSAFCSPLCLCRNFNSIYFFSAPDKDLVEIGKKFWVSAYIYLLEKAGQGKKAFEPHTYLK